MKVTDNLHFIITGGTIDSRYDPISGETMPNKDSYIPEFIDLLKLYESCNFTTVCMKDSRNLDDSDRTNILRAIKQSQSHRLIVTHGSYTVSETARYIKNNYTELDKTVIFVCSMIPIKGFDPNDAGFNLGYAVAKSQDLSAGIYVCMNGKVFSADEVTKIISEGRFGSVYTK